MTIGRHLSNDVVIQESTISREHAEVRIEAGKFIIKDLDSTGGTYVNGTKITESVLHSGDSVLLSAIALVFVQNAPNFNRRAEQKTGQLSAPGHDEEKTIHENKLQWRVDED